MSEPNLKPIWDKIDLHGETIKRIEIQQGQHAKMLEQHDQEFRRMNETVVSNQSALMTKFDGLSSDVQSVIAEYNQRKGADKATSRIQDYLFRAAAVLLPVLVSCLAILVTIMLSKGG